MKIHSISLSVLLSILCAACGDSTTTTVSGVSTQAAKEALGQKLFFDTNLSSPPGQACASCHDPAYGFTDPDKSLPTSAGANPALFDDRHAPTAAYALYSPEFHFDQNLGGYIGGQFWDGRATDLSTQAKTPFLEPVEMANPDLSVVVSKVQASAYASLMTQVYGESIFSDNVAAYQGIADAIAAFERTSLFHPFNSKYDQYLAGKAELTAQEAYGLQLFNDPGKGNCAACHPSTPAADGTPPLFTNFAYANIGLPLNANVQAGVDFDVMDFRDYGLGGRIDIPPSERGKFKIPTLRNIAITAPYGHNGIFSDLEEMIAYHNARDAATGRWEPPEAPENLDVRVGNLGLTDDEIDAIAAFLTTLTDGYSAAGG
ncbi:cytochrome c peroxidase [Candidatus Thiothrix sp. Deng01]|uniref:Cytochrome c peroxidase n=1 Tax=Candidatus Thiothrix phosphatis TaxID=3112415 RepID=A0ABU6CU83_9GAMM|nr:cytochrome c peroxidase [Candidatus Thiothrix sp. Deng01]MEB4590324.1 cytochrome c peroxidase [Candidatus Thiothrix sp. Deng01]